MNPGLEHLRAELDRTGVISDDFKKVILGWSMDAVRHAYELGFDKAREIYERNEE